jgi:hypothetical protein
MIYEKRNRKDEEMIKEYLSSLLFPEESGEPGGKIIILIPLPRTWSAEKRTAEINGVRKIIQDYM